MRGSFTNIFLTVARVLYVDDAGFARRHEGKIYFGGRQSTSCQVKGNIEEARKRTNEIAVSILGAERVG